MKVKNIKNLIEEIRPFMDQYLEMHNTEFGQTHFTCPNRISHSRDDYKPSAAHYPNNDGFKCFSCDESGDIFSCAHFLEGKPLTGSGFISDNVLYLANIFGIEYELEDLTEEENYKDKLSSVLQEANSILTSVIKADHPQLKDVQEYVSSRGWEEVMVDFEFGYGIYNNLINVLNKKGYSDKLLMDAGLLSPKNTKGNYEQYLFDKRLVFPIRNHYNKIVGFGSRLINAPKNDKEQKYLQSRNNLIYNKTNTLFNLNRNRGQKKIYVVEGYGDVFTLHKFGIKNCIALCGLSFKEERYKLLVKNGIEDCVFCFDNDSAGQEALNRIVNKDINNLSGLNIYIKNIPEDSESKDVDEFINNKGVKAFSSVPELTIFEWKLGTLEYDKDNTILKNDCIMAIVNEKDYTNKDRMCTKLATIIDVSQEAVKKEVERHKKVGDSQLTTSESIFEEMNCFEKDLLEWDRRVWSRSSALLGLNADNFPLLTRKMDGIQNCLYVIGGKTNLGKSAFLLNLALSLTYTNDDVFVLFFSVDDTLNQIMPRLIALDTEIAINTISNPKWAIERNNILPDTVKRDQLQKRHDGIEKLKNISDRFALKEENSAKFIEEIEKYIDIYKNLAGDKQLVVFIDNIHRIKTKKKLETRQTMMEVSDKLKYWKTKYDVPMIVTSELRKSLSDRRPTEEDIKETGDIAYDADAVGIVYSDFHINPDTALKFEYQGEMLPVVEMTWCKNKTSDFKGKIYYKFFPDISKYVEFTYEECKEFLNIERNK